MLTALNATLFRQSYISLTAHRAAHLHLQSSRLGSFVFLHNWVKMATPVDAKLLKQTKFPPEFSRKVDMTKVNIEVMKKLAFPGS